LPVKAMSELVLPMNLSDGFVVDTKRRFHAAWPASHKPACKPTRGSGLGAEPDWMTLGDGPALIELLECEQATTVDAPMANDALIIVDTAPGRAHERRGQ
jgi:hypothetical protein